MTNNDSFNIDIKPYDPTKPYAARLEWTLDTARKFLEGRDHDILMDVALDTREFADSIRVFRSVADGQPRTTVPVTEDILEHCECSISDIVEYLQRDVFGGGPIDLIVIRPEIIAGEGTDEDTLKVDIQHMLDVYVQTQEKHAD